MKELTEVAAKYAAEKTNEVMINAIAKAYADGYRDGYKDREEEIPVDLRSNETEYVDLGLPSGTLWAKDYETIDRMPLLLTHGEASNYDIPSEEQWKELVSWCKWYCTNCNGIYSFACLGPNGNEITFPVKSCYNYELGFWLIDENGKPEKNAAYISARQDNHLKYCVNYKGIQKRFPAYKLPILLVRTKQSEANV